MRKQCDQRCCCIRELVSNIALARDEPGSETLAVRHRPCASCCRALRHLENLRTPSSGCQPPTFLTRMALDGSTGLSSASHNAATLTQVDAVVLHGGARHQLEDCRRQLIKGVIERLRLVPFGRYVMLLLCRLRHGVQVYRCLANVLCWDADAECWVAGRTCTDSSASTSDWLLTCTCEQFAGRMHCRPVSAPRWQQHVFQCMRMVHKPCSTSPSLHSYTGDLCSAQGTICGAQALSCAHHEAKVPLEQRRGVRPIPPPVAALLIRNIEGVKQPRHCRHLSL